MVAEYEWVLFDADETLFHFDSFSGLKQMFAGFGVDFSREDYAEYELRNKPLWVEYQNGTITSMDLQTRRFSQWAERLDVTPQTLNDAFQQAMATICTPLEGAVQLLDTLKGHVNLGIITNGFTELQQVRLQNTGLQDHFDILVVSEEVGVAKPDRKIFDHALRLMGDPLRDKVLMVGDNPDSDILGGLNAGLHTCWLNRTEQAQPAHITPNYQVRSLHELHDIVFKA
nr:pyrimidine 5'-nucleotidase [Plesiomonas shigelloides]